MKNLGWNKTRIGLDKISLKDSKLMKKVSFKTLMKLVYDFAGLWKYLLQVFENKQFLMF